METMASSEMQVGDRPSVISCSLWPLEMLYKRAISLSKFYSKYLDKCVTTWNSSGTTPCRSNKLCSLMTDHI